MNDRLWRVGGCLLTGLLTVSCSMIDEDLSDCVPAGYEIDYELRLVTNMTTELRTELTTETDLNIAQALRTHLSSVFTDYAHDVDLSFYDTFGDSVRLQHDEHIMDANQASYELNLPKRQYMHLAAANVVDNPLVTVVDDDRCHPSALLQTARDTISSHTTGVFTARQAMEVLEGIDQSFNVHLYMANCAAALVVDPRKQSTEGIRVFTTGFATGFSICDSVYHYSANPPVVRTYQLSGEAEGQSLGFCSVNFPSREPMATRTVIETTDPFVAQPGEETLWEFRIYVPQPDGTTTESILGVKEPLRAGQLKIVKCWLGENGRVESDDQTVAISVTLDWKSGTDHVVPL